MQLMGRLKPGSGQQSRAFCPALGVILMVIGTEAFLNLAGHLGAGRWLAIALVGLGVIIIGMQDLPESDKLARVARQFLPLTAFSLYVTASAFFRYTGISKDVEVDLLGITIYFLKILVATLLVVGLISILRHILFRNRLAP